MFTVRKCPVCRDEIRESAEDYLFMTARGDRVVQAERRPPIGCPDGGRVYEAHERCAGEITSAPPT